MLVYACNDLLFASKIAAAARAAGLTARPARSAAVLRDRLEQIADGKPNGAVDAAWIDLEREDALELVRIALEHTPRPAVLAFGPHVDVAKLRAAADAGAEAMPRGRFVAELDERAASIASSHGKRPT